MTVTQDPYSRKYCPASSTEWDELLSGLGINSPPSFWLCDETSGDLVDSGSGGRTVTVAGGPAYAQAATGWARRGIKPTDNSATMFGTCTIPDVSTTSSMLLQMFSLNTPAAAARGLCRLGTATREHATLQAGNKLRGWSGGNNINGVQQHAGTMIVLTKFDRANSVLGVYTAHEQLKPTWTAPGASTTMYVFGDGGFVGASDATLVYAAYWSGADAEISDSQIQDLLDAINGSETTLEKMQAGSFAMAWVAAIEGCKYLLSDAPAEAVLNAYAGRDWTEVLGGSLFVELDNEQSIEPMQPFTKTGGCTLRVHDTDGSDVFGTHVARRAGGDQTTITSTVDRDDTTINVKSAAQFAASGEIFIGTECIGYTSKGATSFIGCTRGKYSPSGTALSGSGGVRFGNHHPVGSDIHNVQLNPTVSSLPRVWIGKRVVLRLHTWDAANNSINSRAEARIEFAGRIAGISDDQNKVGITVITLEHAMTEFANTTIGGNLWNAEIAPGISLLAGRVFNFQEIIYASSAVVNNANPLTVVAGTPASTNEIQAGRYSLPELCEAKNRWLGAEKQAGRIDGFHSFSSPVSANDGLRTKVHLNVPHAEDVVARCTLTMPSEVSAFLGIWTAEGPPAGATAIWPYTGATNTSEIRYGFGVPFTSVVFRVYGPESDHAAGGLSDGTLFYDTDNERGAFENQYASLPASVKAYASELAEWGLFLLDDKVLIIGHYDSANQRLKSCAVAPYQIAAKYDTSGLSFIGRRADDPNQGPITIRQVLVEEGGLARFLLELAYSTGASGYNHATYDTRGAGFGVAMPGELLGPEFERSLWNLPQADAPGVFIIDEPTKLIDLIGGDLKFQWAFLRWINGHFEFCQWKTPLNELAVATLDENNKALPAGEDNPNYRVASQETNEHQHASIQIDYGRDVGFGMTGEYFNTAVVIDHTAASDAGYGLEPTIIRLRNTFVEFAATGNSVKAGMGEFISHMPSVSSPTREIDRTIDHRQYALAPGDIVTVNDDFARDPLTGTRGVASRAGFVTRVATDLGGPSPEPGGKPRDVGGDVTINFLDTQRGSVYAPSADIDETEGSGGFSAGYDSATRTIRCHAHHYSNVMAIPVTHGTLYHEEPNDATRFDENDEVLIIERDPPDPANPLYWERTVESQSGDDLVVTVALSAPAWDATKRYRIVPRKYSEVQTSQREAAYQADDDNEMVEDVEIPWHFSNTEELADYDDNTAADPAELVPDMCFGDGRPYDVGHDKAIARTINAFVDYKSAHQAPFLWTTVMGPVDETSAKWQTFYFGRMFLGTEHLTTTVSRGLRFAPFFHSRVGGNTGKLRVTIMDTVPSANSGGGYLPGEQFRETEIIGRYARSTEWSTDSVTWQTGDVKELSLNTKDIFFGFVWILIEGTGYVQTYGLAECSEGPRVAT